MKCVGVIPARMGSSRLPGKPLQPILGKPLIQWVIEGALKGSKSLDRLIVATDDQRVVQIAESAGVQAVMTASDLPSGTDRVFAAIRGLNPKVVLNIQGDEPLITGDLVDKLAAPLLADSNLEMSTLGQELGETDLQSLNSVKVILNQKSEAIYFSRFPIPFSKGPVKQGISLKHLGLYAYQGEFLKKFCAQGPVDLEVAESLEQLRALYLGARIRVVPVKHDSWGVDTPEDVIKVEEILRSRGVGIHG